jgi:hypothetical protein
MDTDYRKELQGLVTRVAADVAAKAACLPPQGDRAREASWKSYQKLKTLHEELLAAFQGFVE